MRLGVIGNVALGTTTGIYSLEDSLLYNKGRGSLQYYSYNSKNKPVGTQDATPGEFCFSADGTKCYLVGTTSNVIWQYTLSTPWDISTASYASKSLSLSSLDSNVQGIYIRPDGINCYLMGASLDRIFHYVLSTPWDISTASFPNGYNAASQMVSGTATGVRYGDNGTKMYIVSSSTTDAIYQYTLSTAWDVSTASYASKSLTITQDTTPQDIAFSSDGTKCYVSGDANNTIYQYTLSTAWDISTGTYASKSLAVGTQDTSPRGFTFSSDGTKGYIMGNTNTKIFQYTFSTAWDISTGTYSSKSILISSQIISGNGLCFSSDGSKMYIIDDGSGQGNAIYQYDLSTPWDVSTASYSSKNVTTYAITAIFENAPTGIDISSDGKMIIFIGTTTGGAAQSKVFQYPLSTAYDLATANTYFSPLVTSQDSVMASMFFKPDGTKVYLLGGASITSAVLYQYTLSVPWNISTMSYDSISLNLVSRDSGCSSIVFNKTGYRLLITGSTNDKIYEYNLSNPWDISTAFYTRNIDIIGTIDAAEGLVRGLAISDDNSKLYIVGESLDTIYQYDFTF